jgi:hypothetical protein
VMAEDGPTLGSERATPSATRRGESRLGSLLAVLRHNTARQHSGRRLCTRRAGVSGTHVRRDESSRVESSGVEARQGKTR